MLERKSERIESITPDGSQDTTPCDLSKTGISCFHTEPRDKSSFVVVKINDLLLRAKVIYCQKREKDYRLGLQFWNILPERQAKLNELVENYSRGVPITCEIIQDAAKTEQQSTKKIIITKKDKGKEKEI